MLLYKYVGACTCACVPDRQRFPLRLTEHVDLHLLCNGKSQSIQTHTQPNYIYRSAFPLSLRMANGGWCAQTREYRVFSMQRVQLNWRSQIRLVLRAR